jgi:hypothetical protein
VRHLIFYIAVQSGVACLIKQYLPKSYTSPGVVFASISIEPDTPVKFVDEPPSGEMKRSGQLRTYQYRNKILIISPHATAY